MLFLLLLKTIMLFEVVIHVLIGLFCIGFYSEYHIDLFQGSYSVVPLQVMITLCDLSAAILFKLEHSFLIAFNNIQ